MIAVRIGTTGWRAASVLAIDEVEFTGEYLTKADGLTPNMVWDSVLGNVRAKTSVEIQADDDAEATNAAIKAQDVIDRQDLKAAAEAIKTDIQAILSNANAYIASPATNNAQATAQILQITKDLKTLTQDFSFVSKVVKGLV